MITDPQSRHGQHARMHLETVVAPADSDAALGAMIARDGATESKGDAALRLYRLPKKFRESELTIKPERREGI